MVASMPACRVAGAAVGTSAPDETVVIEPPGLAEEAEAPPRSEGNTPDEVWTNAADAAVEAFLGQKQDKACVLLPSGAGDVIVGLRTVLGLVSRSPLPFRAVVVVPEAWLPYAQQVYLSHADDRVELVSELDRGPSGIRNMARHFLEEGKATVILATYADMLRIGMTQMRAKAPPVDLLVWEGAHLYRAGAVGDGVDFQTIKSTRQLFLSARRLAGLAPGALLAPGQEPGYPGEMPSGAFGPEVYRLTHRDTEERRITVPLKLAFLEMTNVDDAARELAALHETLNVTTFQLVPEQKRLTEELNAQLQSLTGGACTASTGMERAELASVDAIIVVGSMPSYNPIWQQFSRLARWAPGKRAGYILIPGMSKEHTMASWLAIALEERNAEEAIQRSAVEAGRLNHRLQLNQIPIDLRRFLHEDSSEELTEEAVAKAVDGLADPWDAWLGRLLAWKDRWGHANPRRKAMQYGYQLGFWLNDERKKWIRGGLEQHKTARLAGVGVLIDLGKEMFARGLQELRTYVKMHKTRVVPWRTRTAAGFPLGAWVVRQRTLLRKNKLSEERVQLLQDAFFAWRPQTREFPIAEHPEDDEAAELTISIEEKLREARWWPLQERKRFFKEMVLKHHPDISEEKHADKAMAFLSEVKDWFLSRS